MRSGKGVSPFPPGGEALLWTGRRVPERHTAPVIVGGAAVDETFAESIGAVYAADAMATVRAALKLI